jgi:serine/threonine protein kinase
MAGTRSDWEQIGSELGSGGQSTVFLVRNLARQKERAECLRQIRSALDSDKRPELAAAIWSFARPDITSELGALKLYKIPPKGSVIPPPPDSEESEAIERLRNEVAALSRGLNGLPKLLDYNEDQRWIVTEYFPERTLRHHPHRYRGKVLPALRAFRSLVQTVADLHENGLIHRDIKPANVFIRNDDELVPGDFGIVYVPEAPHRLTLSGERVGPRDYMPPWANLGARLEQVKPNFDVYMLGKVLWSMIDGHPVLPREYHKDPEYEFDLTKTFPNDPHMHIINAILDKCVVERADQCLPRARDLLSVTEKALGIIERGGQLMREGVPRPCHICGKGFYQPVKLREDPQNSGLALRFWVVGTSDIGIVPARPHACDYCGHLELFTKVSAGG